jgi:hypothetical protein
MSRSGTHASSTPLCPLRSVTSCSPETADPTVDRESWPGPRPKPAVWWLRSLQSMAWSARSACTMIVVTTRTLIQKQKIVITPSSELYSDCSPLLYIQGRAPPVAGTSQLRLHRYFYVLRGWPVAALRRSDRWHNLNIVCCLDGCRGDRDFNATSTWKRNSTSSEI